MEWIVFDYAGVISLPPPDHAGALLPQAMSADPGRFWESYWGHRESFDLGAVSAATFWRTVGRDLDLTVDDDLVQVLAELDLRAWNHVNPDTLTIVEALADEGAALALLSNAPVEMARAVDGCTWADHFRHRFFSADLGLAKPDPRIYRVVCERLGAAPDDVVFVDDRAENVAAAELVGMRACLFSNAQQLQDDLPRLRETTRDRRVHEATRDRRVHEATPERQVREATSEEQVREATSERQVCEATPERRQGGGSGRRTAGVR